MKHLFLLLYKRPNLPPHARVQYNSNICTNLNDTLSSVSEHSGFMNIGSGSCLTPCNQLDISIEGVNPKPDSYNRTVTSIYFEKWVKKHEEMILVTPLSLMAEVGGYVGIFLGYSLLNLADSIYSFTNKRVSTV